MEQQDYEKKLDQFEKKLEALPDVIIQKLSETMDLKIKVAKGETERKLIEEENKLFKWIIVEGFGLLLTICGFVISQIVKV